MTSQDCQTATNQIGVGVVDMFLYLYVENYDDVVNKSYDYEFLSYNGILKTMNQQVNFDSQIFNFPKQRKINFISCAFFQQQATLKNSLTDFGVRFYQIADTNFSDSVNGVNYYDQICFLKYNITFHHFFYYIVQVICITTWNITYDVLRFVLFVLHI